MVHFVGAGSGAVDLITVRGKNLLEQADVIIYAGSLVNPQLLDNAKKECEIHNSAYMTLEEVIEVMKDAWERNLDVVRLHTGEPSIYGAAGSSLFQSVITREMPVGTLPVTFKFLISQVGAHEVVLL